ncbi:MAG: 4-(cytidine 5'-diphospho)-2-C-methyl-D-erythritol kinase [Candidatus Caldatribacterium sp.]|nr:4-(cytidine 5'-diphospho)-2-C-methyl-D-erythritol kinase [Candidatus Caldatribacterium sp.]
MVLCREKVYILRTFAKINWFLLIEGLRADGYHDILSLMQQIALCDEIRITESTSDSLSCNLPIPLGEEGLLARTLSLLREAFPELSRFRFSLEVKKSIPPGGGLGGGSSNVAALLRFLPRLAGHNPSLEELIRLALSLGSDIPFFVVNAPFALVTGRGESVTPLSFPPRRHLVLLFPPFPISTAWAYRRWDEKGKRGPKEPLERFLKGGGSVPIEEVVWNDFEEILFAEYPVLEKYRDTLLSLGCRRAFVTGSGSTIVGVVASREEGEEIVAYLKKKGLRALCTETRSEEGGEEYA